LFTPHVPLSPSSINRYWQKLRDKQATTCDTSTLCLWSCSWGPWIRDQHCINGLWPMDDFTANTAKWQLGFFCCWSNCL